MSNENQIDSLKANLALAVQVIEAIAEGAGIDLDKTALTIAIQDTEKARVPASKILAQWKKLAA